VQNQSAKLTSIFNYCVANGFPFAFYRLPQQESVYVVAQFSTKLNVITSFSEILSEEGFVVAPFQPDENTPLIFIKPDLFGKVQDVDWNENSQGEVSYSVKRKVRVMSKKAFRLYVERAKRKIKKEHFEKIVTARTVKVEKPEGFHPVKFFKKVCGQYEWSFVSCVFLPGMGTWVGASPELLLGFEKGVFNTYSLAGTQTTKGKKKGKVNWGEKEKREQEIVSNYIKEIVQKHPQVKLTLIGPETVAAGNIMHLRTTFIIENIPHFYWTELVEALHPTPAVGGLPKQGAIEFILLHEKQNRAYYSGFLGPVNLNDKIDLFVNLRCMEVQNKNVLLHVGCGITEASDSEKEWEETKLKSQTLLKLVK
jgi:isochorismate synthase